MKKYIIILFTLVGCNIQPSPDSRNTATPPKAAENQVELNKTNLEVIGVYDIKPGWLYVYKLGEDTLYIAEGMSSSYPISVTVK